VSNWQVAADLAPEAADAFSSLESVFALAGEAIASDPLSEVIRVGIAGQHFYVKRYWAAGKGLRRFVGRPRVKAEWQNLQHFDDWGIAVAPVVAWGLQRRAGLFRRGALITEEVPGTTDMAAMALAGDPRLGDPEWVRHVSEQLADATRTMHGHHFAHNVQKWRNLLVDDDGRLFLIDCPSGDFWWGPVLRHRIIKDLACLDKVARYTLSRTQRLRFYLCYQQRARMIPEDKAIIRKTLVYFEGRE